MSEENVEIVRRAYEEDGDAYYGRIEALHEAYESGNFGEFLPIAEEMLDADFVLRTPEGGVFPEAGTQEWQGREGFIRFVAQQAEAFEAMSIEPDEFIDVGDKVVVPLQWGGRARSTGIEVRFAVVHVVTIRDGKATRLDMYLSKAEALEAAWLSEDDAHSSSS
jgi:ketosteroid isomerase-like protein